MAKDKAQSLLASAGRERNRLRRHLLVAAALREILSSEPVVVGGTAEEFWTADEYHETDLDICVSLRESGERELRAAGFRPDGRHWVREDIAVAVEFPDSKIDGDPDRTILTPVGTGAARIIGVDDLYIDRLMQATMREDVEGIEFHSALAVAAACFEQIDWVYVRKRITSKQESEPAVGVAMRKLDSTIRRRVRRLEEGEA